MNQINELFTNAQIDLQGLPEAEQMEMIPLEPAYKTVRYISAGLVAFVLIFGSWLLALFQPDSVSIRIYSRRPHHAACRLDGSLQRTCVFTTWVMPFGKKISPTSQAGFGKA